MESVPMMSQGKEERVLVSIFDRIGRTNCVAVEFGALDGVHGSNTAHFRLEESWHVELFDAVPLAPIVHGVTITAENINDVFDQYGVPYEFDLLSIDIDGNDLWVWQALAYRPRVVVIEFNPKWGPTKSRTVPYDPDRFWDGTNFYGASVLALTRLAKRKGYSLTASTRSNLFFVQSGLLPAIRPSDVPRSKKQKRDDPLRRRWVEYA
jgi:hypothetical protein